ncbi:hypothetical protein ABK040_005239 [Willaertia magna]
MANKEDEVMGEATVENTTVTNNPQDNGDNMTVDDSSSNSSSVEPQTPKEKVQFINNLLNNHPTPKKDEVWYVIDAKWFRSFQDYGETDESPGPIDNNPILQERDINDQSIRLKDSIQEREDYELIPSEVWKKLFKWFSGGPEICRYTIKASRDSTKENYIVELRPFEISIALLTSSDISSLDFIDFEFSKNDTIEEIFEQVKRHFSVENKECKLWKTAYDSPYEEVKITEETAQLTLENVLERRVGQKFIIEAGPNWSIDTSSQQTSVSTMRNQSSNSITLSGKSEKSKPKSSIRCYTPGVCGLSNLGNTCFMNSGLQCLTHSPIFHDYFINDFFQKEINVKNPLGMGGKIAIAFGNLMKEMWSGENNYVSPVEFKQVIGRYAPQFAGYQQQDSQELISFLLDGLHEDLNRITDKPLTQQVETKGRDEDVVAKESWEVHKKRNNSIIVDKFQGQLKSTLVCPKCEQVSVTFDPFMYLTLPIPIDRSRLISVIVFLNTTFDEQEEDNNKVNERLSNIPVKVVCKVSKQGSISELRDSILEQLGFNPTTDHDRCIIYEVFSNRVYKYLSNNDSISGILENDTLHAQILPPKETVLKSSFSLTSQSFNKLCLLPYNVHHLYQNRSYGYGSYTSPNNQLPFISVKLSTAKVQYNSLRFQTIGAPFVIPLGSIYQQPKKNEEEKQQAGPISPSEAMEDDNKVEEPTTSNAVPVETIPKPTNADLYEYCFNYMRRYFSKNFMNDLEHIMVNHNLTLMDFMPTESNLLKRKKILQALRLRRQSTDDEDQEENEEDEDSPLILFYLKYESESSLRNEFDETTLDGAIPCNDELVQPPESRYSSSKAEKKSMFMYIPHNIEEKLLDYQTMRSLKEHPSVQQKLTKESDYCHITQCLELFTTTEKLSANDTWYCPNCKDHVQATKKVEIWKSPDILVVHLKRFQFNAYTRDKIDRFIDYPLQNFDLEPYVQSKDPEDHKDLNYDLFAISDHYGGLGGGHYTAVARNHLDGKWYKFDDSRAGEVSSVENIKSSSNYVLFYVRKKLANCSAPYDEEQ